MLAVQSLAIAWALGIALSDLSARRIPNVLSLGACACGLIYLAFSGYAVLGADWLAVLVGIVLAVLLTLPAYLMRWLGAGDVKLLLAIAVLGGWKSVLGSFAIAGLLGGIAAVAVLQYAAYSGRSPSAKRWLPFGAMLASGFIVSIGVKW